MGLWARRGAYLNVEQTTTIEQFGAQCATQIVSLETVVGSFFKWLVSQNLTGEQFHAAHQTFKAGVTSTNGIPKKKVNSIMNAIAEVIQSPVWQWNVEASQRHKKAQIAFHAMLHQNSTLEPAYRCTKCPNGVGIVVRCSGYPNPCENHFHVGCAASFVEQTKSRFKRYYCDSCSLSIDKRQFKSKKKQAKPVLPKAATKLKSQQQRDRSKDSATKESVSVSSATAASCLAEMREPQPSKSPIATANAAAGHGHASAFSEQPPSGANDAPAAMSHDAVEAAGCELPPALDDTVLPPAPDDTDSECDSCATFQKLSKRPQSASHIDNVLWDPNVTEQAILTLQSLDRGASMASKEVEVWVKHLRARCTFMHHAYRNEDFDLLAEDIIEYLGQYKGKVPFSAALMKPLLKHLQKYGWVLSPHMWSHEEILLMCIITTDANLQFDGIKQKDKAKEYEKLQNRGMAPLDNRVQAIMHARLVQYQLCDTSLHLPPSVPSAVVLNSCGSYLQMATWEYVKGARFVTDPTVQHPLIHVTGAPQYVHCNAYYVATSTTRPNGSTVYVSVSPNEMYGPVKTSEDSREWDGVPLARSLHPDHPLKRLLTRPTQKKPALWATERVAYWEDGHLCFQSVTAYGTKHYMMQMQCVSALSPATSTKVITNYNWDAKIAIMTACDAKPVVISLACPEGSRPHRLAFGLQKCAVRYSKDKPEPLRKQVRGLRFRGEG